MMLFNILIFILLLNYYECFNNNINKTKLRGQYNLQKEEIINILTDRLYKKRYENILFHSASGNNYYETTLLCNQYKKENVNDYDINNISSNEIKELFVNFHGDEFNSSLRDVLILLRIYDIPKELIIQKVIDKLRSSLPKIKINEYNDDSCKYFSIAW
jgi:hypothetical protein